MRSNPPGRTQIAYRGAKHETRGTLLNFKSFLMKDLAAQIAEILQFLGHDSQLAFLPQTVLQSGSKRLKCHRALLLEHLIGEFFLLFFKIVGVRLLLLSDFIDKPVRTEWKRSAHVAGFHLECRRHLLAAGRACNGTVARE